MSQQSTGFIKSIRKNSMDRSYVITPVNSKGEEGMEIISSLRLPREVRKAFDESKAHKYIFQQAINYADTAKNKEALPYTEYFIQCNYDELHFNTKDMIEWSVGDGVVTLDEAIAVGNQIIGLEVTNRRISLPAWVQDNQWIRLKAHGALRCVDDITWDARHGSGFARYLINHLIIGGSQAEFPKKQWNSENNHDIQVHSDAKEKIEIEEVGFDFSDFDPNNSDAKLQEDDQPHWEWDGGESNYERL